MDELLLPGAGASSNIIPTIQVNFKAKSGVYNYFDDAQGGTVDTTKIEGVVVGEGLQFNSVLTAQKTKTSSKVVTEYSFPFSSQYAKTNPIKITKTTRSTKDGQTQKSSESIGSKSYREWKDVDKKKVVKVIYVMDALDPSKIYRISFTGLAFKYIVDSRCISQDMPHFITSFTVSDEATETDNGDFYTPVIAKTSPLPKELVEKTKENLKKIDDYLNNRRATELPTLNSDVSIDDITEMF